MTDKKLSLFSGTSYAVGSIIGSGILFLPSLTYKLSGSNVFLAWSLATFLCIPLLIIFYDMSKSLGTNEGVKGFIEIGLGKRVGQCFPVLMLSTVSIGMPSSALIVGKFVQDYVGRNGTEYFIAFYLLAFGLGSNLLGKNIGQKVQNFVSISFFVVALLLFVLTVPAAQGHYSALIPDLGITQTFSGITMAFWAFAGFENLTFIIQDFKNPRRDFLLSMLIALTICGMIYLALTANYAAIVPYEEVQSVMGLFQLSQVIEPSAISGLVIVALAIFALKTNFNSWIRGLSSMIRISSSKGHLPLSFQFGDRPIYLLGSLFSLTLLLSMVFPQFQETGLVIVSSNFVVIYVLSILSYLRVTNSLPRRMMAFITLIILLTSLMTSGEKLLYPLTVMALTYLAFKLKPVKASAVVTSLVLMIFSSAAYAAPTQLNVALIYRFEDKFNGTTQFLDKGFEFAQKALEKDGKIKINFKRYSHDEKLVTVIEATQKAIADGNFVIIGGENSDEAIAIAETIKDKNIVLITPTSTNPKVTSGRPFVFRTCVSDDIVADKLAQLVSSSLTPKSVGIVHNVSYPYSDFLSKRFSSKFRELIENSPSNQALRPKIVEQKIVRNQKDFTKEIKVLKDQGVTHLILLSFQSDLLRFQSQAASEDFQPTYIGSDGWGLNESVQKQVIVNGKQNSKFIGLRNVYWDQESTSLENLSFKEKFKGTYGQAANPWSAIAYDTLTVLVQSFRTIKGKAEGVNLKNALKSYRGKNLLTTTKFSFNDNNSPAQDVVIYRIDEKGIGFYGKI